ncbi:MAG: alpha/beta hydrolase [Anaerolineales bacterium]|nr:alpha/beta hydrolase [Anaerolineales bacterium]MCB9126388.1 alpha/beta hydrolase [Ardenticatenales bacterium]MCB9171549.1 alpha/beta hydrolase [Ardenticatenales bacterium]
MTLNYVTIGSGPPLIFVHGLAGSNRWWARNSEMLSKEFTVYLIDLPGLQRAKEKYHPLAALVDSLPAWLDLLNLERVNLVGHSMGGYIALHLAATAPARVTRLALLDSVGMPTQTNTLGMMGRVLKGIRHSSPSFIPTVIGDGLRTGPPTLLRLTDEILAVDARPLLREIRVPTLVMWGTRDTLLPAKLGRRMAALIPNASFKLVPRAGHNVMADQPLKVNRYLRDFFIADRAELPAPQSHQELF